MNEESSIISVLGRLKADNDPAAAQAIWQKYFVRLARLARGKIKERQRRVVDEEDIALSAFNSFFRGVADGRFPKLDDGKDLWQILVMLTERKAVDQIRRHMAAKRGGGQVRGDSAFQKADDSSSPRGMDQLAGAEPSAEFVSSFLETCENLLSRLNDPELVQVVLYKMEGYSNEEIAAKLGRVTRSVERKLHTIRKIWEEERTDE